MSEMAENNDNAMDTIAEDAIEKSESAQEEKFLIFSILGRQYSFPSRFISEITLFETVYPLPLMPAYVLGVINRYSIPYALFDIGLLLFKNPSPRNKVLILKDDIDRIAFLIDDVIGLADIPSSEIIEVERSELNDITETVLASFKWNDDDVFVLDINRIMAHVTGTEA